MWWESFQGKQVHLRWVRSSQIYRRPSPVSECLRVFEKAQPVCCNVRGRPVLSSPPPPGSFPSRLGAFDSTATILQDDLHLHGLPWTTHTTEAAGAPRLCKRFSYTHCLPHWWSPLEQDTRQVKRDERLKKRTPGALSRRMWITCSLRKYVFPLIACEAVSVPYLSVSA